MENVMKGRQIRQYGNSQNRHIRSFQGFTVIELIFVLLIAMIMAAMAVPLVNTTLTGYRLRGAASSLAGSIQGTRYQAIFNGYPFRLVVNSTTGNAQVQRDANRLGIFTNYCYDGAGTCPVSLTGTSSSITLDADTTLTFSPGGGVQSTTAAGGVTTMVLTYKGKTETITVSSYGNVKVTP
jgi:Tfp pilus assembly protein FimT